MIEVVPIIIIVCLILCGGVGIVKILIKSVLTAVILLIVVSLIFGDGTAIVQKFTSLLSPENAQKVEQNYEDYLTKKNSLQR